MNKKDKMLKKFYHTQPEATYLRIIKYIEDDMTKSQISAKYIVCGSKDERVYVINRLKSDGFDVSIEAECASEHDIRVKWL